MFLVLIHESNFDNKDEEYRFRNILMFATHPQRLFYEPKGSQVTLQQDMIFQVASLITDVGCDIDPEYYRLKKWYVKMPSLFDRARQKAQNLTTDLSLQGVQNTKSAQNEQVENTSNQGAWSAYFSSEPHSNSGTRRMLPAAITATKDAIKLKTMDWQAPIDFPAEVQEWFKGQKNVLSCQALISCSEDVNKIFEKCISAQSPPIPGGSESHRLQGLQEILL
jgi:hypothetical protein